MKKSVINLTTKFSDWYGECTTPSHNPLHQNTLGRVRSIPTVYRTRVVARLGIDSRTPKGLSVSHASLSPLQWPARLFVGCRLG